MAPARLNGAMRRLFRAPVWLYRWKCGWLLGHRFLLLIHTGRRSGLRRYTVLEVMEFRKAACEAVVMSAWGRNADWLRNIEEAPSRFQIVIGSRRFAATYRVLGTDEAASVIAGYERRNRLIAPIIRAGLSWLLGWRYDGSEHARRRAAAQVPYIAFRPVR
jgi:deazaflavin-dependent oxidoreductase (nitroreductase family)